MQSISVLLFLIWQRKFKIENLVFAIFWPMQLQTNIYRGYLALSNQKKNFYCEDYEYCTDSALVKTVENLFLIKVCFCYHPQNAQIWKRLTCHSVNRMCRKDFISEEKENRLQNWDKCFPTYFFSQRHIQKTR